MCAEHIAGLQTGVAPACARMGCHIPHPVASEVASRQQLTRIGAEGYRSSGGGFTISICVPSYLMSVVGRDDGRLTASRDRTRFQCFTTLQAESLSYPEITSSMGQIGVKCKT